MTSSQETCRRVPLPKIVSDWPSDEPPMSFLHNNSSCPFSLRVPPTHPPLFRVSISFPGKPPLILPSRSSPFYYMCSC